MTKDELRPLFAKMGRRDAWLIIEPTGVDRADFIRVWKLLSHEQRRRARGERPRSECLRPMPNDFPQLARQMTTAALAKHYRAGLSKVQVWRKECGISSPVAVQNAARAKSLRQRHQHRWRFNNPAPTTIPIQTAAEKAVSFLRHYGTVMRCTETGKADLKGKFWNRNGFILTDDDVIARAARLGFDADDWKKIAA